MNGRPLWLAVLATPFRACHLCQHGVVVDEARHCQRSEVARAGCTVPVHTARAPTGPCGPDARFMDFHGMNP